jgi:hypothetical protein
MFTHHKYIFMHRGVTPDYRSVLAPLKIHALSWWRSVEGISDVYVIFVEKQAPENLLARLDQLDLLEFETGEFLRAVINSKEAIVCITNRDRDKTVCGKRKSVELEGAELLHRLQREEHERRQAQAALARSVDPDADSSAQLVGECKTTGCEESAIGCDAEVRCHWHVG